MEYIVLLITIAFLIIVITLKGIYDSRADHKRFLLKIKDQFGTFSNFEITETKMNKIKKYYLEHKDEGWYIDDITWHDLDMNAIFEQMNTTLSSAGEEYLYYMLRTPVLDENELLERERLITYFSEHEKERIRIQDLFHKLGTTGKYSLYDYLNYLENLGKKSNLANYLGLATLAVAIAIIPFNTMFGIIALVAVLIYNIVTYLREKNDIKPYLTSFAYILRLIDASKEFDSVASDDFMTYKDNVRESCDDLKRFSKFSFITMSMGEASSNPLDMLLDYFRMVFHIDLIKFNRMLNEIRGKKNAVDSLVGTMGYIESMIVIANYRAALEEYAVPTFSSGLEFEEMYHPLLENPVANELSCDKCILLTGSNASGKSTFLKMVAINCILAQTVHTCTAVRAKLQLQYIFSSMKLEDSIEKQESYYMAEIRAIKRIIDVAGTSDKPIVCFVDEVLRGTNTVERIAASSQILKTLSRTNVICFAATHDIELTSLLENEYDNYHFTEEIREEDIYFSYKILKGPASTRNAILLLDKMGYPKDLVQEAKERAKFFMERGIWEEFE